MGTGALNISNNLIKKETYNIDLIWFDENINNIYNQESFNKLKTIFINSYGFQSLDDGFEHFYSKQKKNFKIILVIVSGKLFGRYTKKIKDNIKKIINIPYTFIFTSKNFKGTLLDPSFDNDHILSYDTRISVNNSFYNPGGVYDNFNNLLSGIENICKDINDISIIKTRIKEKLNYEGVLTFEYLESEEDLLAPAIYKDIITNEEITEEDCKNFHDYIISYKETNLNCLIKGLELFKYIPYEILCKYWARCYTIESDFYKILNNNLMKSKIKPNYKTFIKMLYTGIEINSLQSYRGDYLYRGSSINKSEIDKINSYISAGKLSNIVVFSKAFLSFSECKEKAIKFCGKSNSTKVGCLYILENSKNNLHESNADIQNISVFPKEKEILFFPGSSFIIKEFKILTDDKIEIILNYNGKFKEKYSFLFEDNEKLNSIIYNNILTKNIAGKKLEFLKGGKYLKGEKIDELGTTFKGKNMETDEIVSIKKINKNTINDFDFHFQLISLLEKISKATKNSVKYIEHFETINDYYIIQNVYDDNLENYMKKNKRLNPMIIHKIFKRLNTTLKELIDNNIFIKVRPSNILIKYCNLEKTNFDSFLSDYLVSENHRGEKKSMEFLKNNSNLGIFDNRMMNFNVYQMMNCFNMQMASFPNQMMNCFNNQMASFPNQMMNCFNNQMASFPNQMMSYNNNQMASFPNQMMNYNNNQMASFPNQMMNYNNNQMNNFNINYNFNQIMSLNPNYNCNPTIFQDKLISNYYFYLYSIGLTMYYLYFGKLPFSIYSIEEFNNLLDKQESICVIIKEDRNLENLINNILQNDINKRITWEKYFNHPFFDQYKY